MLDLGCGPGHTTAMLADRLRRGRRHRHRRLAAFVAEAAADGAAAVAASGWPTSPGYRCRVRRPTSSTAASSLVHLPDPFAAMAAWAGELRPGGVLVVEEPEHIETDDPDFRRYLELASVVVGARGGDLYAGRLLADAPVPASAEVVLRRSRSLDVPSGLAATIFSLNLATWKHDPAVAALASADETAELADRFERRGPETATGVIRWWMRQLVVRQR